ncbi:branched-chain amino acid ABC transporter permease [Fodinicola acaciae]|uniref:branched-chain amino acid ABC transporter permease n=1 Tax=Fodinicola acaciae TaxID=2681555 RepID=UPI0013D51E15|nr:branched-chain amino acid ABC transporter permease [Fodinicola acaciae]
MGTLVLSGTVAGLIYGLVACAIVFVYRASRVVNLAQGDIGMVAAFVFLSLSVHGDVPYPLGVAAALACGGLLGWLINRLVISSLGERDQGTGLVVTLALASILQLVALQIWGGSAYHFPPWIGGWAGVTIGGLTLRGPEVLALGVSLLFVVAGSVLYQRSRLGLQLRAVSESRQAAATLGVPVKRISGYAWLLGGMMSAAAALLIAPLTRFDPHFMFAVMTSALVAALLAGFSSFPVAMGAAVLIGILRSVVGFQFGIAGIDQALLLVFAVAVLLVKPPAALRTVK